ncbi:MAG: hypothetical protein LBT55_03090 [Clostridiaceae bacterium]|jgi:hypothetical protein|nr:hypothetical protein [Clostridiaceae bacterium]
MLNRHKRTLSILLILAVLIITAFSLTACNFKEPLSDGNDNDGDITTEVPDNGPSTETETKTVTVDPDPPIGLTTGVGYSINVVTADYIDGVKLRSPVFKPELINDEILTKTPDIRVSGGAYSETSYETLTANFSANFNRKAGLTAAIKGIFSASLSKRFGVGLSGTVASYSNQFFYTMTQNISRYTLMLPYSFTAVENFSNVLSDNYINDLKRLNNRSITFEQFFDIYGTHMITAGVFGGKISVYYKVLSNDILFTSSVKANLHNTVSAGIKNFGAAGASIDFDISKALSGNAGSYIEDLYIIDQGGNAFSTLNMNSFTSSYEDWYKSFNANESTSVLVDIPDDNGLVPLWDILPSEYSFLKSGMEQAFVSYANEAYDSNTSKFLPATSADSVSTDLTWIRGGSYKIDDGGRFNQHHDDINFTKFTIDGESVALTKMLARGYKYISFEVHLDVKQSDDDGNQYLFLFNSSAKNNSHLVSTIKFEHSPGKKANTNWGEHILRFDKIAIGTFDLGYFTLRYGADGRVNDDWYAGTINIKLTFSK